MFTHKGSLQVLLAFAIAGFFSALLVIAVKRIFLVNELLSIAIGLVCYPLIFIGYLFLLAKSKKEKE